MNGSVSEVSLETVDLRRLGTEVRQSGGILSAAAAKVDRLTLTEADCGPPGDGDQALALFRLYATIQAKTSSLLRAGEVVVSAAGGFIATTPEPHQVTDTGSATSIVRSV